MTAAHHTLALADAGPGLCLAEAVVDAQGQVLVGQGCDLTVALIQALSHRGVETVCVAQALVVEEVDPAILQERTRARVAHLFRHSRLLAPEMKIDPEAAFTAGLPPSRCRQVFEQTEAQTEAVCAALI